MAKKALKVSVVLPTYNEKDNIVELITTILQELSSLDVEKEVVLVDDNSPDNTAGTARKSLANNPEVKIFVRTNERGLATAIRYGIEKATGDTIAVMVSDFNHDPKMLPQMIKFLEFYDIIGGSRFTMGGGMYSKVRYIGSFIYNMLIRIMLRTQIQDNLSGFFVARRETLDTLDFDKIFFGYGDYFFRLLFYAKKNNFRILEVPVVYLPRKNGESKTNLIHVSILYTKNLTKFLLQKK
jgi:dolichol-phosphate mannosyltransferase